MNAWVHVDTAAIPGGGKSLALMQRGSEFTIVVDEKELMNSTRGSSEEALASLACARLVDRPDARVLIGGLGMGFTLRAALETLGPDARIVVAELVPEVAAWARGPLAEIFQGCLDDGRVELCETDVTRLVQSAPAHWDAILLDVDNGPEGLMRRSNDRLYDTWGLKRAQWALKPGGVLAVWSGTPDRKFKARIQRLGFRVEEVRMPANGVSGPRHVIWIAVQP